MRDGGRKAADGHKLLIFKQKGTALLEFGDGLPGILGRHGSRHALRLTFGRQLHFVGAVWFTVYEK